MRNCYLNKSRTKGFTLIELIVVIVVMSILSAIGVTSYLSVQHTSEDQATLASVRHLTSAAAEGALSSQVATVEQGACPTSPSFQDELGLDGGSGSPLNVYLSSPSVTYGQVDVATQVVGGQCQYLVAAKTPTGNCAEVIYSGIGNLLYSYVGPETICSVGAVTSRYASSLTGVTTTSGGATTTTSDGSAPVGGSATTEPPTTAPQGTTTTSPILTTAYGNTYYKVVPANSCSPMAVTDANNQDQGNLATAPEATGTATAINIDNDAFNAYLFGQASSLSPSDQADATEGITGVYKVVTWFHDNNANGSLSGAQTAASSIPAVDGVSHWTVVESTAAHPNPSTTPGVISFWTNGLNWVATTITPNGHCVADSDDLGADYETPAEVVLSN